MPYRHDRRPLPEAVRELSDLIRAQILAPSPAEQISRYERARRAFEDGRGDIGKMTDAVTPVVAAHISRQEREAAAEQRRQLEEAVRIVRERRGKAFMLVRLAGIIAAIISLVVTEVANITHEQALSSNTPAATQNQQYYPPATRTNYIAHHQLWVYVYAQGSGLIQQVVRLHPGERYTIIEGSWLSAPGLFTGDPFIISPVRLPKVWVHHR